MAKQLVYEKTWKNTVIKVFSILEIVLAVIALVSSFSLIFGGLTTGSISGATAANIAANSTLTETERAQALALAQASNDYVLGICVTLIITGVIDLIAGILGVRGADNPAKLTPFIFLTVAGLVFMIGNVVMSVINGSFVWTSLISIGVSVFLLFLAFSVRAEYTALLKHGKRKKK